MRNLIGPIRVALNICFGKKMPYHIFFDLNFKSFDCVVEYHGTSVPRFTVDRSQANEVITDWKCFRVILVSKKRRQVVV